MKKVFSASFLLFFTLFIFSTTCLAASPSPTISPVPSSSPLPSPSPTPTISPSPSPNIDFSKLKLSEVMSCPQTGEKEWIELYNDASYEVPLTAISIMDEKATILTFPLQEKIADKEYKVWELSSARLNNSGDEVVLLHDNQQLESITLPECDGLGKSFINQNETWQQTLITTPNEENYYELEETTEQQQSTANDSTTNQESDSQEDSFDFEEDIAFLETLSESIQNTNNQENSSSFISSSYLTTATIATQTTKKVEQPTHLTYSAFPQLPGYAAVIIGGFIQTITGIGFSYPTSKNATKRKNKQPFPF